jgi:predicted Zn-dependent peptidase
MKNYKKIKSSTDLSGFYVGYYGSVMNEHKGIYGLTHLLEHLVCKSIDDLMEQFESDGISWNAFTSDKEIVFYMTGLDKYVKKWKKTFYERITNFNITEEQFQNEKRIIIEEYRDSFNKEDEWHRQNLFRKLYGHYEAIGLLEDLESLTLKDCYDFFELQYKKPTKIIDISKSKDKILEKFFKKIPYSDKIYDDVTLELNDKGFIFEKGNNYKNKTSIIDVSEIIHDDFPYITFITRMIGGGLKSPIYQEIRERNGLVYYFSCYQRELTNNSSVVLLETVTSNKNVDKVQKILKEILGNPDKYLTKERFNIVKKYYVIKFKKENILLHNNGYKFIEQEHFSLEKILPTLTYEDIRRVYDKYFDFSKFYQSIDKKEFSI